MGSISTTLSQQLLTNGVSSSNNVLFYLLPFRYFFRTKFSVTWQTLLHFGLDLRRAVAHCDVPCQSRSIFGHVFRSFSEIQKKKVCYSIFFSEILSLNIFSIFLWFTTKIFNIFSHKYSETKRIVEHFFLLFNWQSNVLSIFLWKFN